MILPQSEIRDWLKNGALRTEAPALGVFACECCRRTLHPAYHAGQVASPDGLLLADVCQGCVNRAKWQAMNNGLDYPRPDSYEPERGQT